MFVASLYWKYLFAQLVAAFPHQEVNQQDLGIE